MRMFALIRSTGERPRAPDLPLGRVAVGVEFDDGQVWVRVLKGQRADSEPVVWPNLTAALEVHNHFNDMQLRFL